MANHEAMSSSARRLAPFAVLSIGSLVAILVLLPSHRESFTPYFGALHPLVACGIVSVVGLVTLSDLSAQGWANVGLSLRVAPSFAKLLPATSLFAFVSIALDLAGAFDQNINVRAPASLLFYPVMGFVVEVIFHALPLVVLLRGARLVRPSADSTRTYWVSAVLVSLIEPAFQLRAGSFAIDGAWVQPVLAVDLFAFTMVQLYVLRRWGFVATYLFRITFYLQWHILWGELRIEWLF